jgi:hypothetical protein
LIVAKRISLSIAMRAAGLIFRALFCIFTRTAPMRRIITLSLAALFIISGRGAALSDSDTFNGIRDGAAITPSDGFVARAEKSATETYSNMRGGTSNKLTMVGSGDDATVTMGSSSSETAEPGEDKEGAEASVGSGASDSSETTEASHSTKQPEKASEATDPSEPTVQSEMSSEATEAGESTRQSGTSETSESSEETSPEPKR